MQCPIHIPQLLTDTFTYSLASPHKYTYEYSFFKVLLRNAKQCLCCRQYSEEFLPARLCLCVQEVGGKGALWRHIRNEVNENGGRNEKIKYIPNTSRLHKYVYGRMFAQICNALSMSVCTHTVTTKAASKRTVS